MHTQEVSSRQAWLEIIRNIIRNSLPNGVLHARFELKEKSEVFQPAKANKVSDM